MHASKKAVLAAGLALSIGAMLPSDNAKARTADPSREAPWTSMSSLRREMKFSIGGLYHLYYFPSAFDKLKPMEDMLRGKYFPSNPSPILYNLLPKELRETLPKPRK